MVRARVRGTWRKRPLTETAKDVFVDRARARPRNAFSAMERRVNEVC